MASRGPSFNLTTWNSQGKASEDARGKAAVVKGFFDPTMVNIVFLQEGGTDGSYLGDLAKDCTIVSGQGVGTRNDRCTPYLLIPSALKPVSVDIGKTVYAAISGGEAGRAAAAAAVGRILLISWHGTANGATDDTANLIVGLAKAYATTYDTIVIGGDFNAEPIDMLKTLGNFDGTRQGKSGYNLRSKKAPYTIDVFASGIPTQGTPNKDKRELDYFVVLTLANVSNIAVSGVNSTPVVPSDHNPVRMVCTFHLTAISHATPR